MRVNSSSQQRPLTFQAVIPVTIAYCLAIVSLGMATAVLGPSLPHLAENTGTRLSAIGFLFTGASTGYMLGSLGIGHLLDRKGGNLILSLILLTMTATLALIPAISSLWLLTVVLLILGIAEGGLDVSANLLLVWVHRERATPYLNALHFAFGVGAFLAPIIIARAVLASDDIQWAFWALAVYPLPIAFWLFRLPSPASPHTQEEAVSRPTPWLLVGLVTLTFVFYVGVELGFGGWIYTYATTLKLADTAGAAYLTSVFWGLLTIGRLFGIAIGTRFKPATILFCDLVGCLLSLGMIWLFPQTSLVVWVGTITLGLSMASIFPTLLAFCERQMDLSGKVTRWFFVGTGIGGMVLPWLLGVLIEWAGPKAIMPALWTTMFMTMLAFLGVLLLARKRAPLTTAR